MLFWMVVEAGGGRSAKQLKVSYYFVVVCPYPREICKMIVEFFNSVTYRMFLTKDVARWAVPFKVQKAWIL